MLRYYEAKRLARDDLRELTQLRKRLRDKRLRHSARTKSAYAYAIKRSQMDLALHRKGLRSPFDYEYPRMDQMNQLARKLYARHVAPLLNKDETR